MTAFDFDPIELPLIGKPLTDVGADWLAITQSDQVWFVATGREFVVAHRDAGVLQVGIQPQPDSVFGRSEQHLFIAASGLVITSVIPRDGFMHDSGARAGQIEFTVSGICELIVVRVP